MGQVKGKQALASAEPSFTGTPSTDLASPPGCHLVGSVPFDSAEHVFRKCCSGLPDRLRRVTDGETDGARKYFVQCQRHWFEPAPEMIPEFKMNAELKKESFTPEQVDAAIEKIKASPRKTYYDDFAIASYGKFKQLREDGAISKHTKFQVSLPTHVNVILGFAQPDFQAAVEPIYKQALFQAMRNVQDAIPHEDLAIQLDMACEYMFLEDISMFRPWFYNDAKDFEKRKEYMYDYVLEQIAVVDDDVELGLHNCYGDMMHTHFKEPDSLAVVAEFGGTIIERCNRPIKFFHCPVPPSAMEKLDHYYEPFKTVLPKLKQHHTELYFGVLREEDLEDSRARVEAAKKAFPDIEFGVATECGMGRISPEQADGVMKMACELAEPVF